MLSKKEKKEMLADAKSLKRREAFRKAKQLNSNMTFEEYIDFLDRNQYINAPSPPKKITNTTHNRL